MSIAISTVQKYAEESRVVEFDFSLQPEVAAAGVQIITADVTGTPSGLTIGTPDLSATKDVVTCQIGDGAPGVAYILSCIVTTDGGATLEMFGRLKILNPPA